MSIEKDPVTDLRRPNAPENKSPDRSMPNARTPKEKTGTGTLFQTIWETVRYALIAALIIIPIRTFIAQPFVVSGNSMFPTFHNGEYLIVNELVKYQGDYKRGDVIIFKYPNDPSKYFIKRIIGLPGETVTITNGVVSISGPTHSAPLVLDEPYVKDPTYDSSTRTLDTEEYFVMGDNRAQSSDSRIWGPVPKRLMDGEPVLRLFPFTQVALHPGSLDQFGVVYK